MTTEILKCIKCSTYTLNQKCPKCGEKAITPKPAKFSIEDKYGRFRRLYKQESKLIKNE